MKAKHKEIAEILLELEAIKLNVNNPFTWASGIQSPIYCDNRMTLSHPEERSFIAKSLVDMIGQWGEADIIAGVATAGIPYAALVAHIIEKPLIYVRSKAKGHGRKNLIEGDYKPGSTVIVIEDLISTGGSSISAAQNLQDEGLIVAGIASIFSYELKSAQENFDKSGIKYLSLSNYKAMLEKAREMKYINESEWESLQEWNQDPENWKNNTL
ncbi:orotate phosphoribosyltransferase [Membranihabitans maritimus]|uniref:orotate phosphoribosyltransferase n=1 Tax=Membranihabitans maritimus TaxID=2904244 RepID=UPI001F0321EC|nr:orotate phosphoribosyltransferase [Membranihabitans maritimus]